MKGRVVKHTSFYSILRNKYTYISLVSVFILVIIIQFLYPSNRTLPFQRIDGVDVSHMKKSAAISKLDKAYTDSELVINLDNSDNLKHKVKLKKLGVSVSNKDRVKSITYPWYIKLIPSSIVWYNNYATINDPVYSVDDSVLKSYFKNGMSDDCAIAPVNASAKIVNDEAVLIKDAPGVKCDEKDLKKAISNLQPTLPSSQISVKSTKVPAKLKASDISDKVKTINKNIQKGLALKYKGKTYKVDSHTLASWIQFNTKDDSFETTLDKKSVGNYLSDKYSKLVTKKPGVSRITTHNLVVISKTEGAYGQELNTGATINNIKKYILGTNSSANIEVKKIKPSVKYNRTYSNTNKGISALMENFAKNNPGTYGISYIDITNGGVRSSWNKNKQFMTASTYKLYVAFSTLKRIDSGEYKWSDSTVKGRDLKKCFKDMIEISDNACALALVHRIGYKTLTEEARSITGTNNTTFLDPVSFRTTASDLSVFMASLATGNIPLTKKSQDFFISTLKKNVYRKGIPSGSSGVVADKVGFLYDLLHDSAIVYGPKRTYVLVVLTDKSSWANIAHLTKKIEDLTNK